MRATVLVALIQQREMEESIIPWTSKAQMVNERKREREERESEPRRREKLHKTKRIDNV